MILTILSLQNQRTLDGKSVLLHELFKSAILQPITNQMTANYRLLFSGDVIARLNFE